MADSTEEDQVGDEQEKAILHSLHPYPTWSTLLHTHANASVDVVLLIISEAIWWIQSLL